MRSREESREVRRDSLLWDWRSIGSATLPIIAFVSWVGGAASAVVIGGLAFTAAWIAAASFNRAFRQTLQAFSVLTVTLPTTALLSFRAKIAGNAWENDLRQLGVRPLLPRILQAFLGDDPDELLMADSYDGLRSSHSNRYVVDGAATEKLERKISQMDGGTIAVCGPRGAGKTTLLAGCMKEDDFAITASAPASFTPHDFLISLFIDLCETYIHREGGDLPNLVRLTATRRMFQKVRLQIKKKISWLTHITFSLGLVLFGSFATARALEEEYGRHIYAKVAGYLGDLSSLALAIWRGENLAAGLAVTGLGVLLWRARRTQTIRKSLKNVHTLVTILAAGALYLIPLASLLFDSEFKDQFDMVLADESTFFTLAALAFITAVTPKNADGSWSWRHFHLPKRFIGQGVRLLTIAGMLATAYRSDAINALLSNPDSSVRVFSFLCSFLIFKLGTWDKRPSESWLVAECRDQLYRLQTVQTSGATVNTGLSQIASLGSSHTASLSSIPPNFPALVGDFRSILESIAWENHARGRRTFICIDEMDRLGTDSQALAFLGEIKAVFGVPQVHYVISVAEDVGASFVRRGMPHRDVTDSSLDDVVHVQACTLPLSEKILQKRAPGISPPYIALAHALSGGLPRDLVRYGRRILEAEASTGSAELTRISRTLILEELSETLSGFRVLLSKHRWDENASVILESFRHLTAQLRFEPISGREIRRALVEFSGMRHVQNLPGEPIQLTEETAQLIEEASTYCYFSLTLLDIFGEEGFTRRSEVAANRGPEGTPQLLAEARQELAVSPHTSRRLLRSIREAWDLESSATDLRAQGVPAQGTS
ncbi:hypothetical protein ACFV1H_24270 [Streptomyces virginiae]|uniref:hypothetical protein n=1 Tax=Streptomyces virginiae TaxID=1961 RepID=UPI0036B70F2F